MTTVGQCHDKCHTVSYMCHSVLTSVRHVSNYVVFRYHYPGTSSPPKAQNLPIPLWASEDYSTPNDMSGGGCWARVSIPLALGDVAQWCVHVATREVTVMTICHTCVIVVSGSQ